MNHTFTYQVRTRYGETDQMGVIYYGIYPQYLEIARVEWLRSLGISYKELEVLSIVLTLKEPPTSKIIFEYELFNEKQELLSKAHTTLVFVDKSTFKPIKCPSFILEKINA